ncbi:MAG: Crp/Fnr family transcriptional regulator [Rhodoferax sp.]|nr:Crp/Fnr family transcriptional regulator [Rhodoferax sp.]MDP3651468.1 Crp/Fnr family transcriptional regulator [Rhodoferax sp.]
MFVNQSLLSSHPVKAMEAGSLLLQRLVMADTVIYIESGRVGLGVLGVAPAGSVKGEVLEHQLRVAVGPCWLEATAAVLNLPSAVDAVAETDVTLRRVPMVEFQKSLDTCCNGGHTILMDVARAHRVQTDLVVSRLAKDAEARCAEWLLRQASTTDKGDCSVQLQQRKRMIATQLGIAPETLSRVLRHLRERSLISGTGRVVNLVDIPGLRSLAGV